MELMKNLHEEVNLGKSLPLMEAFYTLQGEGYHKGSAAYFIRIGGCDVGCHWCDVKESWDPLKHAATPIKEIVKKAIKYSNTIVITGGEPLMWNMEPLTNALKENKMQIHIETSGAYNITGHWDWFCLSPKKNKLQALPKLGPETLKIKERLLGKRSDLLNLIQSSKSLERDVGDLTFSNEIDLASSLEGREMIFQLTSRDRNELRLIEDALFRINEGTYGACESCEKKISLKRLQIMPLTALCIDCQEAAENI